MNTPTLSISITVLSLLITSANADIIIPTPTQLGAIEKNRVSECQMYVQQALQQQAKNLSLACGFSGSQWNNDRQGQYNWCMTVLDPASRAENNYRKDKLASCQTQKTSPDNPANHPDIPAACNDPSKQYKAVKSINHSYRYEKTITMPVLNGLIRYDYNRDKKTDYAFLEVSGNKARVTMCFSQGSAYQRRLTDFKFYAPGDSTMGSEYLLLQAEDLLLLNINYFEHNGGTSGRYTSYRYQTDTKKFKIIENTADAFGIEMDGYTYPIVTPESYILF